MKTFARLLFASLAIVVLATAGLAQTSVVRGQVVDEQGAVISGAKATLVDAGGKKRSATANANGEFSIPNVPTGVYNLSVEFKGFDTEIQENVQVPSASALKITL